MEFLLYKINKPALEFLNKCGFFFYEKEYYNSELINSIEIMNSMGVFHDLYKNSYEKIKQKTKKIKYSSSIHKIIENNLRKPLNNNLGLYCEIKINEEIIQIPLGIIMHFHKASKIKKKLILYSLLSDLFVPFLESFCNNRISVYLFFLNFIKNNPTVKSGFIFSSNTCRKFQISYKKIFILDIYQNEIMANTLFYILQNY